MAYPRGPHVLTGVLIKGRGRQERLGRRWDEGNRGWRDVGPSARECRRLAEVARP